MWVSGLFAVRLVMRTLLSSLFVNQRRIWKLPNPLFHETRKGIMSAEHMRFPTAVILGFVEGKFLGPSRCIFGVKWSSAVQRPQGCVSNGGAAHPRLYFLVWRWCERQSSALSPEVKPSPLQAWQSSAPVRVAPISPVEVTVISVGDCPNILVNLGDSRVIGYCGKQ